MQSWYALLSDVSQWLGDHSSQVTEQHYLRLNRGYNESIYVLSNSLLQFILSIEPATFPAYPATGISKRRNVMKKYYYSDEDQNRHGPFTVEEFYALVEGGTIKNRFKVFRTGMNDWARYESAVEIQSEIRAGENRQSHGDTASQVEKDEHFYGRVLGLNGEVTRADLRKRYLDLATKYHPDKVNHLGDKIKETAEREMKEINEAYDYFKNKYGM